MQDPTGIPAPFDAFHMSDQDRQEAKDANWECPHGKLPHDADLSCGCWPAAQRRTPLRGVDWLRHRYGTGTERKAA
jgi:hypothetical protein